MSLDSLVQDINGDKDITDEPWFPEYTGYVHSILDLDGSTSRSSFEFERRGYLEKWDRLYYNGKRPRGKGRN